LKLRLFSLHGDLFATTVTFVLLSIIRLGSSLILTRLLQPEAYGIMTILNSIGYVVEMLGDIAVTVSIVRHELGEEPAYLNTAWTLRLLRALFNTALVYGAAPLICSLYRAPELTGPLRVFSLWFLIAGFESMSFPLAIRRKRARVIVYAELAAGALSTLFTVLYCYYTRSFWGMVFGSLLNRLLVTVFSYRFYPDIRPRLQIDRRAASELLRYTRFAMPSSLLTLAISQFDKVVFLRLFDLKLLGVYGLAGNLANPIEGLIQKFSQLVLYPRCAHDYRADPRTFAARYYTENVNIFVSMLILPAVVGGAAQLLIRVLYRAEYAQAGIILQAFMVRAAVLSLASSAEDMLIAAGQLQVQLVGNVLRAIWMVAGSLAGYYLGGFMGFVYGASLSGLAPLGYYLWLQRKKGFLVIRYEVYRTAFVVVVAILAYVASDLLLPLTPVRGN
jgi:O-antigen/teichoic acid export membrane protein